MYDAVIIGGGHNGLVAAAYLAKKGAKVRVLERRNILGGCCSTEELWPGFKVSPAAYVISLFLPEIIKELDLKKNGLSVLPRHPSSFTPDLNGPGLLLGNNKGANQAEINYYSEKDAKSYREYEKFLIRIAENLEPLIVRAVPSLRDKSMVVRAKAMLSAYHMIKRFAKIGKEIPDAVEVLTGDAATILDRWFESDILKATLAGDAIIGSFTSPYCPGSAYILLHHVMGESGGARGVWGYVRGGMGGLADALAKTCEGLGVEITRETEVARINVDIIKNKVVSVTTNEGKEYQTKSVASSIDANQTLKLLSDGVFPEEYTERLKKINYSSASAKINMALDGLPQFVGMEVGDEKHGRWCRPSGIDADGFYHGTIHIAPSINYIEEAYHDARMGWYSENPVLEITLPSVADLTLAPAGKQVMQIFVQYAPYNQEGGWEEAKDVFFNTCMNTLEKYAPGIKDRILHYQVLTPVDLERTYGLTGGNIFQGAMVPHQMGPFRTNYKTPVKGLYMCGAAVHPGGGVIGACGKNCAEVMTQ